MMMMVLMMMRMMMMAIAIIMVHMIIIIIIITIIIIKPLRACYCSEMFFLRCKKAPAGMSLLRNAVFEVRKSPCGNVTAQKRCF